MQLVTDTELPCSGKLRQWSITSNLISSVNHLMADLTSSITLEAGEFVSAGMPNGVGTARTAQRWLRARDLVQVTLQGLNTLDDAVIAEGA